MYRDNGKLLRDEQVRGVLDQSTGEFVKDRQDAPSGKEYLYDRNYRYNTHNKHALELLHEKVGKDGVYVVVKMMLLAKRDTNSLQPLSDKTTVRYLAEEFGIGINRVKDILDKLFNIGVYGVFKVRDSDKPYTNYWVLNPYLTYSGKFISSDIKNLFKGTELTKYVLSYYENNKVLYSSIK